MIFLFGGFNNGVPLSSMDIYLPTVNRWCPVGSAVDLPFAMYSMEAAALPHQSHYVIYVTGGIRTDLDSASGVDYSNSTLAYDPFDGDGGTWTVLAETLPETRAYAGLMAIDCEVYILGGTTVVNQSIGSSTSRSVQVLHAKVYCAAST